MVNKLRGVAILLFSANLLNSFLQVSILIRSLIKHLLQQSNDITRIWSINYNRKIILDVAYLIGNIFLSPHNILVMAWEKEKIENCSFGGTGN